MFGELGLVKKWFSKANTQNKDMEYFTRKWSLRPMRLLKDVLREAWDKLNIKIFQLLPLQICVDSAISVSVQM